MAEEANSVSVDDSSLHSTSASGDKRSSLSCSLRNSEFARRGEKRPIIAEPTGKGVKRTDLRSQSRSTNKVVSSKSSLFAAKGKKRKLVTTDNETGALISSTKRRGRSSSDRSQEESIAGSSADPETSVVSDDTINTSSVATVEATSTSESGDLISKSSTKATNRKRIKKKSVKNQEENTAVESKSKSSSTKKVTVPTNQPATKSNKYKKHSSFEVDSSDPAIPSTSFGIIKDNQFVSKYTLRSSKTKHSAKTDDTSSQNEAELGVDGDTRSKSPKLFFNIPLKKTKILKTDILETAASGSGRKSIENSASTSSTSEPNKPKPQVHIGKKKGGRSKTTGSCTSTNRKSPRGGGKVNVQDSGSSEGMSSSAGNQDANNSGTTTNDGANSTNNTTSGATSSSSTSSVNVNVPTSSSSSANSPSMLEENVVAMTAGNPWASFIQPGGSAVTGLASIFPPENDNDDPDVGRLQALLESRGLPPHLFGALGPRMQHLLQRSIGSTNVTKAHQLLAGLQATGDEGQQLQSVIEMCQMLVMGNEDTLAGFPVKQVVPYLIVLLSMEHNFDMMNHACRALTYMMEALPRSSAIVVDAIPAFLQKLQVIQCMDVAEQSLTALEMLSRRHSKAILQAHGVAACLMYLDFFSIAAQRAALSVTSNCSQNVLPEEFNFIQPSLHLLSTRLNNTDKKSVESVCIAFSRLVESFQGDKEKLREIAGNDLLTNLQQLLVVSPPIINSNTFIMVLRMLTIMCSHCSDLAVTLLKQNIADTLCYLLTGSPDGVNGKEEVELISRTPQELYEITCLIGELMPKLPSDGLFSVDALLDRTSSTADSNGSDVAVWHWKDDRSVWHPYTPIDCRIIEASYQANEEDVTFTTGGRTYTIDFHLMQQINDDTGTTRSVQRRVANSPLGPSDVETDENTSQNSCAEDVSVDVNLASSFTKSLFNVLYEVYSSSAGPSVRYKCLRALLRMVYFAPSDLLETVLKNEQVSSHLAGMMASQDLRIVVGALQLAEILMQKLPTIFRSHFIREGVMHQVQQLINIPTSPLPPSPVTAKITATASAVLDNLNFCCITTGTSTVTSTTTSSSKLPAVNPATIPSSSTAAASSSSTVVATTGSITAPITTNPIITANATANVAAITPRDTYLVDAMIPIRAASSSDGFAINESDIVSAVRSIPINNNNSGTVYPLIVSSDALVNQPAPALGIVGPPIAGHGLASFPNLPTVMMSHEEFGVPISAREIGLEFRDDLTRQQSQVRLTDVLKRKRAAKRQAASRKKSEEMSSSLVMQDMFNKASISYAVVPTSSVSTRVIAATTTTTVSASSTNRSRFTTATMKTSNFLASLNPARWAARGSERAFPKELGLTKSSSSSSLSAVNREKVKTWIREQATKFFGEYNGISNALNNKDSTVSDVLSQLTKAIKGLEDTSTYLTALTELKDVIITTDISPFELNHSGLVRALLKFLTRLDGSNTQERNHRLRCFIHVFAKCPLNDGILYIEPDSFALSTLVNKLNSCISQLEQFPVKVHDFPSCAGNTSALRFFNTHQLKCQLQRHPDCSNLKQWKGGVVKIDPLALVQAIERYLFARGYARIRDNKDLVDSDDDNSDDDVDDTFTSLIIGQSNSKHKLQFLMGGHVLPHNMTIYQAVRQFSPYVNEGHEADMDGDMPIGSASIWVQTHVIYYRSSPDDDATSSTKSASTSSTSHKKGKSSSSKSNRKKYDELWNEGTTPMLKSPLDVYLSSNLPTTVNVHDASLPVLALLRVLHAVSRDWGSLYTSLSYKSLLSQHEFINTKITAKASRQLQDPLVIMTGNLPSWVQQITRSCPFLLPFEIRQLLFYVSVFDRDRALQRLLDANPELTANSDSQDRVAPRLDRRKKTVSREDILKQAEAVISEVASSKALLEIQYEDEVGTGLGPTLEFYSLVSRELQRANLELWSITGGGRTPDNIYMFSSCGLFPSPLGRSTKVSQLVKVKSKFRFIGKLMAKAVMDSRLLDIPFSVSFYRWLLGQESTLTLRDLNHVAPDVYRTISRLQMLIQQKRMIENDSTISDVEKYKKKRLLTIDGCQIEDLGLDFTLPGYPGIELKKGGKDTIVNLNNVEQYIKLVCHWFLVEGVSRQMESFREGFESVFPLSCLNMFYPEELDNVFCGSESAWDAKMLTESFRPDHGYTVDSKSIQYLFEILSSYKLQERRDFLQFVTGSPRLPVGGFKSLSPLLTVVRKTVENNLNPDDYLPSVMTCVNYLKLPDYSNVVVMRDKLRIAAIEGQNSFHLS